VNTNLRLDFDCPPHVAVLRLYQRGAAAARLEAAVGRLIEGRVPRAAVLHDGTADPAQPWALLALVPGTGLEAIAVRLDPEGLRRMARVVGRTLAAIHAIRFDQTGFLDDALRISPIDLGAAGLRRYVEQTVRKGRAGARLGETLAARLLAHVAAQSDRLDEWADGACLVHGDCNPSNVLVRPAPRGWKVAAVLDWEYALSAHPPLDIGTLLRPPVGPRPGFAEGLAEGYVEAGGWLPKDWQRIAKLADVFAWADLIDRAFADAGRIADAKSAIAHLVA